jgi:acyl-CoA thioesterase-2
MWFHRPFRADEWLLCETVARRSSAGPRPGPGRLFRQDGALAVSVVQVGLLRVR